MTTKKRQPQRQAVPLTPVIASAIRAAHEAGNRDLSGLSIEFNVTLTDVNLALASEDSGTTNEPEAPATPPPATKPKRARRAKKPPAEKQEAPQAAAAPAPAPAREPAVVTVASAGPGATAIVIDPSAAVEKPRVVKASLTGEDWRAIVFADLHVSADTLTRCIEVLRRLRIMALEHNVDHVVFLGDWWDRAGHLPTRVLHALLGELREWESNLVRLTLIPGNHDHVSVDGSIHGAEVFAAFRNVTVVTEPIWDDEAMCAYLPWREDPAEQAALFAAVPDSWTVFAHAELPGATTNHAHHATGRVSMSDLSRLRATYCGHYHLRQQIGTARAWYIGNPYEKDAGEAGQPKGCALVDSKTAEPAWVDWSEEMPRHLTIRLGSDEPLPAIKPTDSVDVFGDLADLKRPEVIAWVKQINAARVRPRPIIADTEKGAVMPAFAVDVDQAMHEIAKGDEPALEVGRALLAEASKGAVAGGVVQSVRLKSVEATDFCRLRGTVSLDLDAAGLVLVKGPIGSGKTALLDAVTWCLYDTTTPRKAGAMGASLTGDEVINDDAKETVVTVRLHLSGEPHSGGGDAEVAITRTKRRGKGSRVTLDGVNAPDGIRDGDELARWLIGYDYSLWRSACSLGQGAVASFVTATDKARKELLSGLVPGLDGVAAAREEAKARHRATSARLDKARIDVANAQGLAKALRDSSFESDAQRWDEEQAARLVAAQTQAAQARTQIEQLEAALVAEPQWRESQQQYQDYADALTKGLAEVRAGSADKHQRVGALRAELSVLDRDIALGTEKLADITARVTPTCPTCGQAWGAHSIEHHEQQVATGLHVMRQSAEALRAQLAQAELEAGGDPAEKQTRVASIEEALAGARAQIATMGQTLNRFAEMRAQLRAQREAAAVATASITSIERAVNPWREKQREQAEKLAAHDEAIARLLALIAEGEEQVRCLGVWVDGFGPKGVIALVLRTLVYSLQMHANRYLSAMYGGTLHAIVSLDDDTLGLGFWEWSRGEWRARRYEQLSGGQRRLVELSFSPLALADIARERVSSINALFVDELTTHLSAGEKTAVVQLLASMVADGVVDTIVTVDHDAGVQDAFTHVLEMQGDTLVRVGGKSE